MRGPLIVPAQVSLAYTSGIGFAQAERGESEVRERGGRGEYCTCIQTRQGQFREVTPPASPGQLCLYLMHCFSLAEKREVGREKEGQGQRQTARESGERWERGRGGGGGNE